MEDKEGRIVQVELGLPTQGRLLALGHYFGPRQLDALMYHHQSGKLEVYEQLQIDDLGKSMPRYRLKPTVSIEPKLPVLSALIGDYNHDGRAQILAMLQGPKGVELRLYSGPDTSNLEQKDVGTMKDQPLLLDYRGRMLIDFFGLDVNNALSVLQAQAPSFTSSTKETYYGQVTGFQAQPVKEQMCIPRSPHHGAFADFNGDGIADILVVCERLHANSLPMKTAASSANAEAGEEALKKKVFFEIWLGTGKPGEEYDFGLRGELPAVPDTLVVADMDADGSLDVVMTSGSKLYIFYNTQKAFCTGESILDAKDCKSTKVLFAADEDFGFAGRHFEMSLPDSPLTKDPSDGSPLAGLQVGDIDADGFPDVMFVGSGGFFSSRKLYIFKNVPDLNKARKFVPIRDDDVGFSELFARAAKNPVQANFAYLSPDGFPDFCIQTQTDVHFFRNELYRDVFFLRAEVLNGVCSKECKASGTVAGKESGQPYGGGYPGVSIRYHFSDIDGIVRVRTGAQLSQTNYRTLSMPFTSFGLGRVNNFIEEVRVGIPSSRLSLKKTHVIPNSHLLLYPPNADEQHWRIQLYVNPAQYSKWVGVSVLVAIAVFGLITGVFKLRERWEDQRERQKRIHAINFDAM